MGFEPSEDDGSRYQESSHFEVGFGISFDV